MMPALRSGASAAGFTLIEALIATALMGIILAALATITAQWMPNWNRGSAIVQRVEVAGAALDRLVGDLAAAEYVVPNRESKIPLFVGTELSVIFIRTSVGPNAKPGLDIVRIAETADKQGHVLVRSSTPFLPFGPDPVSIDALNFGDPVVLLRSPFRVSFAYAGRDGIWKETWSASRLLPSLVRLTVRDAATEQTLSVSTTATIHVDLPAATVCATSDGGCGSQTPDPAATNTSDSSPRSRRGS